MGSLDGVPPMVYAVGADFIIFTVYVVFFLGVGVWEVPSPRICPDGSPDGYPIGFGGMKNSYMISLPDGSPDGYPVGFGG